MRIFVSVIAASSNTSDMHPEVRPAKREDAPHIHRLLAQLQEITGIEGVAEERFIAQFKRAFASPRFRAFVAEEGGTVKGCITLWLREGLFHGGPVALIDELIVAEGEREREFGSRLLEHALSYCRRQGCVEVEVSTEADNIAARRFYARHGFEKPYPLFPKPCSQNQSG